MTASEKLLTFTVVGIATVIAVGAIVFVSPHDPSIQNQSTVARLLAGAKPRRAPGMSKHIDAVVLRDGSVLKPDVQKTISGYVFKAYTRDSTFTIEAFPAKVGTTGTYNYFRDSLGLVRFEDANKVAGPGSRLIAGQRQLEGK